MKIKIKIPVSSKIQIEGSNIYDFGAWQYLFCTDKKSGFVNNIELTIGQIDPEFWPTTKFDTRQENGVKTPFIEINKNYVGMHTLMPILLSIESYLGVIGLNKMYFSMAEIEWIHEQGDETIKIDGPVLKGFSTNEGGFSPNFEPFSNFEISRCLEIAMDGHKITNAFSCYRIGQENLNEFRYIEAIRYYSMVIEFLFSNRKTGKKEVISNLLKSSILQRNIEKIIFHNKDKDTHVVNFIEKMVMKEKPLNFASVVDEIYDLRGRLSHAKPMRATEWHPSRQQEFKDEAVVLDQITGEICFQMLKAEMYPDLEKPN